MQPMNLGLVPSASVTDLFGDEEDDAATKARKAAQQGAPLNEKVMSPFMQWGGAGSRQMYGAAGLDLGFTPF